MELVHSFTVPAAPERTWALLTDLHDVGSCFPGATVTEADDEEFSGTVKVKLGPIAMVYSGSGRFVSRDDADHRATIEARGKDKRGNGTAGATVMLNLSPDGDGTKVDVKTDLSITGKPAQFGRGVMQEVSDKLLTRFVDCIESRLEDTTPQAHDPVTATEAPPPAETGVAASGVAVASEESMTEPGADVTDPGASVAAQPVSDAAVAPMAPPAGAPSPPRRAVPEERADAIHLGSAVGPVLMSRYGIPVALAGAAAIGYLLGRGRSRSGGA